MRQTTRSFGVALLLMLAPWPVLANAESHYRDGLRHYEAGRFVDAARVLEQAVAGAPNRSSYHHLLGKTYGRLAERSHWWQALGFVRKTREELEMAVKLDPDNPDAVSDLRKFYSQAPGFLGGNKEKARELEPRLPEIEP